MTSKTPQFLIAALTLFLIPFLSIPGHGEALQTGVMLAQVAYPAGTEGTPVVFQFDKPYLCGQYANGDWWVAVDAPKQTVVVKDITPGYTSGRNGWCANPVEQNKQPFDDRSRLKFDAGLIPSLPYSAGPGTSLVKAVSSPSQVRHSFVQTARVLTVVAEAPAYSTRLFRPPYMGSHKKEFRTDALRMDFLPRLARTARAPSKETAEQGLDIPRLDYISNWSSSDIRPVEATFSWGAEMAVKDCETLLWLCSDVPDGDKKKAVIGLVQYGIDLYGAREELGAKWVHGGGGNGHGRLLPFVFAATMLDSDAMKKALARTAAGADKDHRDVFWEDVMFYRSSRNNGMVLWGMDAANIVGPQKVEEIYWKSISVNPELYKAAKDPYEWIDGAAIPGGQYQGCVSLPVKYTALVLHLIPELRKAWPEEKIKIMEYADRWTTEGTRTLPDPFAPPVKLTEEQWGKRSEHGYGKTWGPDPDHPGEALRGAGRFPSLQGTHINSDDQPAGRKSVFGEEMWNAYRSSNCNAVGINH